MLSNDPKLLRECLHFIPLGGTGEIGMNLNLYHLNESYIAIDLGFTFADDSLPGIDLILPDPQFLLSKKANLKALIITHGHEDHIGAIPFIWPLLKCPIYATPFPAALIKQKLSDFGFSGHIPITEITDSKTIDLNPFQVRYIPVTHSIPEAHALEIRTKVGNILHTGDWKLDDEPIVGPRTDETELKKSGARGINAVVGDSTNVLTEGTSGSEKLVRDCLFKLFKNRKGAIAVTLFSSNIARLTSVIAAAHSVNREVVLVGRSLWKYLQTAEDAGIIDKLRVLREEESNVLHSENLVFICTGCQGEARAAMPRIASGKHPRISLNKGDTVIFSSKVIPGNEKSIGGLKNLLIEREIEVIDEKFKDIHVSGHPCRDELRTLYKWLRPNVIVPVHGEIQHLRSHADLALETGAVAAPILTNGNILKLAPGNPDIIGQVHSGRLAVDGSRIIPTTHPSIRSRNRIKQNGSVFITLVMAKGGQLIKQPTITGQGILDKELEKIEIMEIEHSVALALKSLSKKRRMDDKLLLEAVQNTTRKIISKNFGKKPHIDVHIVRI